MPVLKLSKRAVYYDVVTTAPYIKQCCCLKLGYEIFGYDWPWSFRLNRGFHFYLWSLFSAHVRS